VCVVNEKRLLVLEPGWEPKQIDFDLNKFLWQSNGSAIRRGKTPLLGEFPPLEGKENDEYTVAVAVLNLKTREIREIGRIRSGWSLDTNVAHRRASATWISREQAAKLPTSNMPKLLLWNWGGAFVVEETDQIVK